MYSENVPVVLLLNPTYVDIRISFSNPRLIAKLTLIIGMGNSRVQE